MTLVTPFEMPSHGPVPHHQLPVTAVLGAGHDGLALAGYLGLMGAPIHLWNRSPAPLQAVLALGGIKLNDELVPPDRVSASMSRVLDGAEVVLVTVPATSHRDVARICAPHLADGQIILLAPGRTGGALEFRQELERQGCTADVLIGETQASPLTGLCRAPGHATLLDVKRKVPVAALPADRTAELVDRCLRLLPMLVPAASVLETSFGNMEAILHPVITLLNANRIGNDPNGFRFFTDGVTPTVATMLAAADAERCAIARAYGVSTPSLAQWITDSYNSPAGDLRRALTKNPALEAIQAPTGLNHRYLEEDVPTGLVPLAALGAFAGVPCPTLNALIDLACALNGCDYRAVGRSLKALALEGLTPDHICRMVAQH